MTNADRKMLTEYLGGCWHDPEWRCCDCGRQFTPNKSPLIEVPICAYCGSPHKDFAIPLEDNRTFTTRDDMMDLYGAVVKAGKWDEFAQYCYEQHGEKGAPCWDDDAWLFCLSGSGYEERCEMVATWIRERSEK